MTRDFCQGKDLQSQVKQINQRIVYDILRNYDVYMMLYIYIFIYAISILCMYDVEIAYIHLIHTSAYRRINIKINDRDRSKMV